MKRCFKCQCEKPEEAFYKHAAMKDGRLGKCKECTKADVKIHRQENLEAIRAYDRMRGSMPHRVAARAEYAKTPEGIAAHKRAAAKYSGTEAAKIARRAYLQSENGKSQRAKSMRRQIEKFPDRHKARTRFGNAVRDGRVIPWPVCAVPDCCGKPQGHHPDYSRPLDVVWLCDKHHKEVHAMARQAA